MPDDEPLLPEALAALATAFSLPQPAEMRLEHVRQFLIGKITELLDHNPAMLMHILYRVDVAERDVQRVLKESAPPDIAPHLADLLIARQLQKVRTRRQYRDPGAGYP